MTNQDKTIKVLKEFAKQSEPTSGSRPVRMELYIALSLAIKSLEGKPISREVLEKIMPPPIVSHNYVSNFHKLKAEQKGIEFVYADGSNNMRKSCINALLRYWGRE